MVKAEDDGRFRARLMSVRAALALSQRGFAARIGVGQPAQGRYEAGVWRPTMPYLERIGALGVSLDWLILGVGRMWRAKPRELRRRAAA